MMRMSIVCALVVAAFGCGSDGGGNNTNPDGNTNGDGGAQPDAYVPPTGYTKLISRTWTLPAGAADTYKCIRITLPTDTYITNISAQAPSGTHHTVLSLTASGAEAGPDGEYDCSVGALGRVMLYASGVGTSPLDFPAGVGVKIAAGQQIHLNLHLYNATDGGISGDSGIWVKAQATQPAMLAEMVFAGRIVFGIPAGAQNYLVTGGCTASDNFTLFALWPHMHQIATHQKFELTHNGTTQVLHDMPYTFAEQTYFLKSPMIQVATGDQIKVSCTYTNTTGGLVTFGDSSNKEMCFTGMYRYPAANQGITECTDQPGAL